VKYGTLKIVRYFCDEGRQGMYVFTEGDQDPQGVIWFWRNMGW